MSTDGSAAFKDDEAIRRVRSEKLSKAIARAIVREIATEGLEPGTVLPPEAVMAERFGVGRPSIREALRLLEMSGLVTIRQGVGGGPIVAEPTSADFAQTLTMYLQSAGRTVADLTDATIAVEGMVAHHVASRVANGELTDDEIGDLVALSERDLVSSSGRRDFLSEGHNFHERILSLTGNQLLQILSGGVAVLFGERAFKNEERSFSEEHRESVRREHIEIAEAIIAGDPILAQRRMMAHMTHQKAAVVQLYPGALDEIVDWR